MKPGNVVMITNVGQGYGRAAALAFGQSNHDVVCTDPDVELASQTAAEIELQGGHAIPIQANMSVQLDVRKAFVKVREIFGELAGVVHVASRQSNTVFSNLGESEFTAILHDNVKSSFLSLKAASDLRTRLWFVVIGPPTSASEPHMLSVQGAMQALSTAINRQVGSIRVNLIFPSRSSSDPKHDSRLSKAALFLGSGQASGISGQTFHISLPPRPEFNEGLLPEVQAALDESVRQDDLEATVLTNDNIKGENKAAEGAPRYSEPSSQRSVAKSGLPRESIYDNEPESTGFDEDFDHSSPLDSHGRTSF